MNLQAKDIRFFYKKINTNVIPKKIELVFFD
jgi:hypothetical protein